MKKKVVSFALIIAVCASLAACGGSSSGGLKTPVGEASEEESAAQVEIQSSEESTGFEGLDEAVSEMEENTQSIIENLEEDTEEEASEESSDISSAFAVQDVLTQHEVYHTAHDDVYDEYTTIFYGSDSKKLKAMFLETRFWKSSGITMENLESLDLDTVYENFSSLSFADAFIDEDEESYSYVVRFRDLDDPDNCLAMHNSHLLTLDTTSGFSYVDAQTIMDDLANRGYEVVPLTEYDSLNLHFSLD
ncbi:MAG: hypothetical protein E7240_02910 [Lachnospiraceae bacterium]|nr:hypothetical protein [Lachnospiraceae bacterium]